MFEGADSQSTEEHALRYKSLLEIAERLHARLTPESRARLTTDDLYDEDGLPA